MAPTPAAKADRIPTVDMLVVLKSNVQPGAKIASINEVTVTLSLEFDLVLLTFFMSDDRFLNRQGPLLRNVRSEEVEVWDFKGVSRADIQRVQRLMNGRPRETLEYRTPVEVFRECLLNC